MCRPITAPSSRGGRGASNDTVRIGPGVYAEQIVIFRKNLTLVGAPGTVIRAKTGMTASLAPYVPLATGVPLLVAGWSRVGVSGLEFEGEHLADSYDIQDLVGLWLVGSSGKVEQCTFKGFRGTNGVERFSIALSVLTPSSVGTASVQIRHNSFVDNTAAAESMGTRISTPRLGSRSLFSKTTRSSGLDRPTTAANRVSASCPGPAEW
jgi:hypothetical protein